MRAQHQVLRGERAILDLTACGSLRALAYLARRPTTAAVVTGRFQTASVRALGISPMPAGDAPADEIGATTIRSRAA